MPSFVKTYDLVLCTSVLEHVTDVPAAAATLLRLTNRGGYLLITVPRSYPRHRAPIDTGYRPSNQQLETLFSGLTVLRSEIICPQRDKWFHWFIFPPTVSIPRVSCVLLQNAAGCAPASLATIRENAQIEGKDKADGRSTGSGLTKWSLSTFTTGC
jgi:methyltransferase family protein